MSAVAPEERATPSREPAGGVVRLPVIAIVWAAAALLFLVMRLWPVWAMPVGGAEIAHLSGAWNASRGIDDARYIPTLFQGLTAATLVFTNSEIPARLLAFLATASLPLAMYALRGRFGEAGVLLALLVLAFDAPSIALGSSATAMGFDLAITLWLFVVVVRDRAPSWAVGGLAALIASAGPIPLPLVAAVLATVLLRREPVSSRQLLWIGGGLAVGLIFTTLRPGAGLDGFTISPFKLFADSYDQDWSTADGLDLVLVAAWPIFLGGIVAGGWRCYQAWQRNRLDRDELVLLLWGLFAIGWWASSSQSHSAASTAAVTLPMALLLGPFLASALRAMLEADWRPAAYLLPVAAAALAVIFFHVGDWAEAGNAGDASDQFVVVTLAVVVVAALALLARQPRGSPTVLGLIVPVAAAPMLIAGTVVAFRSGEAPIPSPVVAPQARNLRDIALDTVQREGGEIVVHPDFEEQLTWPFRDSGNVIVASRVPPEAELVIWPIAAAPLEGFTALEGEWALVEMVRPPTGGVFELVRWYTDRYSLEIQPETVAVYLRAAE